mgnify:CR=1 FL=1
MSVVLGTSLPLLLFTGNSAIAANLIQNGSFEMGPNVGAFTTLPAGSTAINNWIVTDDDIDIVGTFWQASDGQRSIDLNGLQPGAIAQTFNTTIGQEYLVTFDLAGHPEGVRIKTMRVEAAGAFADFTFNITGKTTTNMGWTTQSWQFTAIGTQTTLQFGSLDRSGFRGPALDNVVVTTEDTVVPEPVTILGSLTLLGFGTLMKRQKAR